MTEVSRFILMLQNKHRLCPSAVFPANVNSSTKLWNLLYKHVIIYDELRSGVAEKVKIIYLNKKRLILASVNFWLITLTLNSSQNPSATKYHTNNMFLLAQKYPSNDLQHYPIRTPIFRINLIDIIALYATQFYNLLSSNDMMCILRSNCFWHWSV